MNCNYKKKHRKGSKEYSQHKEAFDRLEGTICFKLSSYVALVVHHLHLRVCHIHLSVSLSLCLVIMYIYLLFCLFVSNHWSITTIHPSHQFTCLSIFPCLLSVHPYVFISVFLSIYPINCPSRFVQSLLSRIGQSAQ